MRWHLRSAFNHLQRLSRQPCVLLQALEQSLWVRTAWVGGFLSRRCDRPQIQRHRMIQCLQVTNHSWKRWLYTVFTYVYIYIYERKNIYIYVYIYIYNYYTLKVLGINQTKKKRVCFFGREFLLHMCQDSGIPNFGHILGVGRLANLCSNKWATKKNPPILSIESWLVNRDSYIGFIKIPIYTPVV